MKELMNFIKDYSWFISLLISSISLILSLYNADQLKQYQYNEFIVLIKQAKDEINHILKVATTVQKEGIFSDEEFEKLYDLVIDFFNKIEKFNKKIPTKHYSYKKEIEELLGYSRLDLWLFSNEDTINDVIENFSNIRKYINKINV